MFCPRAIICCTSLVIVIVALALPTINASSPCEGGQELRNIRIECSKNFGPTTTSPITCTPSTATGFVIEVVGTRPGCFITPELTPRFIPAFLAQRCVGTVVTCVTSATEPSTETDDDGGDSR